MNFLIRGFAAPFARPAWAGDVLEVIDAGAFADTIASKRPVDVRFYNHEASAPVIATTADGSARLYEDSYGLSFEVTLPSKAPGAVNMVRSIVSGAYAGCSINITSMAADEWLDGACAKRLITAAEIDHIAIVSTQDAVYGAATAVWRADMPVDDAPIRIRNMAAQWGVGRMKPIPPAPAAIAAKARPVSAGFHPPGAVVAHAGFVYIAARHALIAPTLMPAENRADWRLAGRLTSSPAMKGPSR